MMRKFLLSRAIIVLVPLFLLMLCGCKNDDTMAVVSQQDVVNLFRDRYQAENVGLWLKDLQTNKLAELKASRAQYTDPTALADFDAAISTIDGMVNTGITEYDNAAGIYNASTDLIILSIKSDTAPNIDVIQQEQQAMETALRNLLQHQQDVQQRIARINIPSPSYTMKSMDTIRIDVPGLQTPPDSALYAACRAAGENIITYIVKNRELKAAERERRRTDAITYLNELKMKRFSGLAQ